MDFSCPFCKSDMYVDDDYIGTIVCDQCNTELNVEPLDSKPKARKKKTFSTYKKRRPKNLPGRKHRKPRPPKKENPGCLEGIQALSKGMIACGCLIMLLGIPLAIMGGIMLLGAFGL